MRSPERTARLVAKLSMASSAILAAVKISVGLAASSVAVVSDGIESLGDCLASGLVLVGLWVAAKPADADHPYGHGRFETLTGLGIGILLTIVGTGISFRSIEQRHDMHAVASYAAWPLIGAILVKCIFALVKRRVAKQSGSAGLQADSWHDVIDMLSSMTALVGVVLALINPSWIAADHYSGVLVGLIVIWMGAQVIRETTLQLMDTMPGAAQLAQVRSAALSVNGARAVEKCYARKTGLRYHVDLHLEVDADLTVRKSHEIAGAVRSAIKAKVDWVEDVLVHVEPSVAVHTSATISL
jgi:cation diffusion facilitator family transporter